MSDDRPEPTGTIKRLSRRLDQQKLTLPVALAFFAALALMCGAAALVGYVVHHLRA